MKSKEWMYPWIIKTESLRPGRDREQVKESHFCRFKALEYECVLPRLISLALSEELAVCLRPEVRECERDIQKGNPAIKGF